MILLYIRQTINQPQQNKGQRRKNFKGRQTGGSVNELRVSVPNSTRPNSTRQQQPSFKVLSLLIISAFIGYKRL